MTRPRVPQTHRLLLAFARQTWWRTLCCKTRSKRPGAGEGAGGCWPPARPPGLLGPLHRTRHKGWARPVSAAPRSRGRGRGAPALAGAVGTASPLGGVAITCRFKGPGNERVRHCAAWAAGRAALPRMRPRLLARLPSASRACSTGRGCRCAPCGSSSRCLRPGCRRAPAPHWLLSKDAGGRLARRAPGEVHALCQAPGDSPSAGHVSRSDAAPRQPWLGWKKGQPLRAPGEEEPRSRPFFWGGGTQ